jgi:GNAT superfamily N-acetyltransferase
MSRSRRRLRVSLRQLTANDLDVVVPWHDATEKLLERMNEAQRDGGLGLLAITFRGEDGANGVMEYCVGVPESGWLGFRFAAVEPRMRGLGLDSEAVRLIEDDALKQGLGRRFWAEVHRDDGMGLYFWLRLGYHPTRPDDVPWLSAARRDTIAMMREPGGRE